MSNFQDCWGYADSTLTNSNIKVAWMLLKCLLNCGRISPRGKNKFVQRLIEKNKKFGGWIFFFSKCDHVSMKPFEKFWVVSYFQNLGVYFYDMIEYTSKRNFSNFLSVTQEDQFGELEILRIGNFGGIGKFTPFSFRFFEFHKNGRICGFGGLPEGLQVFLRWWEFSF